MTKHVSVGTSMRDESMSEFAKRLWTGGARKPLRTISELADELGVTVRTLTATFSHHDGPKPKFRTGAKTATTNTWYDPGEVRAWWRNHNKEQK
jgi:hypothetical protein